MILAATMINKIIVISLILNALAGQTLLAAAKEAAVSAKQFPTGYFFQYQKVPIKEKEKVLAKIDATLKKLNQEGYGLIAKGAVVGEVGTGKKIYDRVTILDESGLIINARRVPNLYYQYPGTTPLNPNIYLIIKNAKVDFPESYIRYGFVVEGDFVAYAHKFVRAIVEGLDHPDRGQPPEEMRGKK